VGEVAVLDEDGIDDRAGDAEDAKAGGLALVGKVEEIGFADLEVVAGRVRGVGDADGSGVGAQRAVEDDALEGETGADLEYGIGGARGQQRPLGQAIGRADGEFLVDDHLVGILIEAAVGHQHDGLAGDGCGHGIGEGVFTRENENIFGIVLRPPAGVAEAFTVITGTDGGRAGHEGEIAADGAGIEGIDPGPDIGQLVIQRPGLESDLVEAVIKEMADAGVQPGDKADRTRRAPGVGYDRIFDDRSIDIAGVDVAFGRVMDGHVVNDKGSLRAGVDGGRLQIDGIASDVPKG